VTSPDAQIAESSLTGASKYRWGPRPIKLEFRLGNFHFFSKTFAGQGLIHHFSRLSNNPDEPLPPPEAMTSGAEVAVVPTHPVDRRLRALKIYPQMIRYVPAHYRRFSIELRGTFKEYVTKFSAKSRKNLAREVRRFMDPPGAAPSWREYRSREELEDFRRLAGEVSSRSWQGKFQGTGFPQGAGFLHEFSERGARDGIRGYVLFHEQQPVAYASCEAENGVMELAFLEYDLEFERWSPGTVLLYLIIQKLFGDQAFEVFDLGGREDWYKEFFSTRSTLCADILYFRRGAPIFLLLLLHLGLMFLSRLVSRAFEAMGLKARVRKLLRRKVPGRAHAGNGHSLPF
jgi:hypothetical protein